MSKEEKINLHQGPTDPELDLGRPETKKFMQDVRRATQERDLARMIGGQIQEEAMPKRVTIELFRLGSQPREVQVEPGTTLGQVGERYAEPNDHVSLAGGITEPSHVVQDGNVVLFSFTVRGEAPPPELTKVRKLLKTMGFEKVPGGGKGDHEKWTRPGLVRPITLNAHKTEPKLLDENANRSLCEALGMKPHALIEAVQNPKRFKKKTAPVEAGPDSEGPAPPHR